MRYCPHCGAVNEEQDGRCFACQRSLAGSQEEEHEALLQGRYQIQTQIGSGGYGAVYRALDRQDHERTVAIKSINLKGLQPDQVIEATDGFNRERQLLSQLSHQQLPQVYDHFTDPDHWYLVIQYIEGTTLEEYLHKTGDSASHTTRTLPLDEVLALALQLCNVLHYLHTCTPPVIYRDIKPSNIMRTHQGQLYLIDFGIARHYKAGQSKDTIPLGSPGYAAPEQYGKAQTTPQADIYSLGALLHQMLSGDDPSETPFSFAPLQAYGEEGFSQLADLIMQMVNLDASQRPSDVETIKQQLQDIIHQREKTAPAPIKSTQTGQATTTRFTPAQPGSPAYSTAYYVPGQTQRQRRQQQRQQRRQQQQSPQAQQKRKLTRRKLIATAAGVTSFALVAGFISYTHPMRSGGVANQSTFSETVKIAGSSREKKRGEQEKAEVMEKKL